MSPTVVGPLRSDSGIRMVVPQKSQTTVSERPLYATAAVQEGHLNSWGSIIRFLSRTGNGKDNRSYYNEKKKIWKRETLQLERFVTTEFVCTRLLSHF
jgi:hypothetical protein